MKTKASLEECHRQIVCNREKWFQTCEDLEKEYQKKLRQKQTAYERLQKLWKEAVSAGDTCRKKYQEPFRLRYAAESLMEEEKGKM